MRIHIILLGCFVSILGISDPVSAQLRVVTYNTARESRDDMDIVLQSIGEELYNGIAKPIDVLILQEQRNPTTTTQVIVDVLNGIYGAGTYARASYVGGPSFSDIRQGLIYNTNSVSLVSQTGLGNGGLSPLQARETLRYQLRPVGYDSSADLFIYNSHYKSGTSGTDKTRRLSEAEDIRDDSDLVLGQGKNVIYAGDFNMQASTEDAFQHLLSPGPGQAFDPINLTGTWNFNTGAAYRVAHTQSPHGGSDPSLVSGGMDDRFDFQLITGELFDGEGIAYIPGSYHAFGNNGSTFDDPINVGNTISFQGNMTFTKSQILDAIANTSDHVPVVVDYQIPAVMSVTAPTIPTQVNLNEVIEISVLVQNGANVVVSKGADELNYSMNVMGSLTGSAVGVDEALGGGNTHFITLDTSTPGMHSGNIMITSDSESVLNGSRSFPVLYEVLAPSNSDFDGDGDVDGSDFLIWQTGFGLNGTATQAHGDANGDQNVDAADLAIWKSQYGQTNGLGSALAVPEPNGIALALVMILYLFCRNRRQ